MSTLNTTNLKNPSSGSNNIVLATDGSTTITTLNSTTITGTSVRGVITSGTAVASTSGTAIDFISIPSWVKRITVMFSGLSTNGSSQLQVQIGDAGGIETTGYDSFASYGGSAGQYTNSVTTGFILEPTGVTASTTARSGNLTLTKVTANSYTVDGVNGAAGVATAFAGSKTLSDTLDRIRITTLSGTDTFDAGTINILYEG